MGNSQSTTRELAEPREAKEPREPRKLAKAPKTSNKLTKPKTNSSSANLLNLSAPSTPSRQNSQTQAPSSSPLPPLPPLPGATLPANKRFSTYSPVEAVAGTEETHKDEAPKPKKRTSIFRSRGSQKSAKRLEVNGDTEAGSLGPSPVVDGWSRSSSMTFETPADELSFSRPVDSKPSAPNLRRSFMRRQSYSHQPRLSLVVEQQTPAQSPQPQDETSKRFSKLWGGSSKSTDSAPESPIPERAEAEPMVYAPIRRRSLLQPGIATRHSYVEPNSRQTLPSQLQAPSTTDELKRYFHHPRKPPPRPLSNLASPSPRYAEENYGPRALTPSDLDYGYIGAFKLGSLRITNGAASPTPSDKRSFTMGNDDEYIVNGERQKSSFDSHRSRHTHRRSNTLTAPNEIIKPPWMVTRAESPLRQEPETYTEPEHLTVKTAVDDTTHTLVGHSLSLFNFKNTTESPTKALELAQEYMQDLAQSPFSFEQSPPLSPTLHTTSKHNEIEDDLFAADSEMLTPEEGSYTIPSSSADSGYHAGDDPAKPQHKIKRNLEPKALAKADSGYSSNVSLRSFKSNAPAVPNVEAPPTPPKESSPKMQESFTNEPSGLTMGAGYSLPVSSSEWQIPAMPVRQAPTIPQAHELDYGSAKVVLAPPLPKKSTEQRWAAAKARAQAIAHPKQNSIPSPIPNKSTHSPLESVGSNSSSRRGEQRPQSLQPIYTIQANRSSGALEIPPVSSDTAQKLEERVSGFHVATFPNTMRNSPSKETLTTIMSAGSAESREERKPIMARMHSPLSTVHDHFAEAGFAPRPDVNRRFTIQTPPPATTAPQRVAKTRQSLPMTPREEINAQENTDFENHITSFENIVGSLGASPYGLGSNAMRSMAETQRAVPSSNARTMTLQLEADARERFARSRTSSQDSRRDLHNQRSYDSIANRNPFAGSNASSRHQSREPSRERSRSGDNLSRRSMPVVADHPPMPQAPSTEDMRKYSVLSRKSKNPPVTMQTQRALSTSSSKSWGRGLAGFGGFGQSKNDSTLATTKVVAPPSRSPNRAPPTLPSNQLPVDPLRCNPATAVEVTKDATSEDPWAAQRSYWASRRQSIENARLNEPSHKSIDARKRSSSEQVRPNLQSRKSLDIPRSTAKTNMEFRVQGQPSNSRPKLSHHMSFENTQNSSRYNTGYDYGGQLTLDLEGTAYDHAYGSTPDPASRHPNKENQYYEAASNQNDEFDPYSHRQQRDTKTPQPQPFHSISTSDMLVLDRYAGGLGYGYERSSEGGRYGLVGSAGMRATGERGSRKSMATSMDYGLDFSDVPVFLTQVRS